MKKVFAAACLLFALAISAFAGEKFDKMTPAEHLRFAQDALAKHALGAAKLHLDAIPKSAKEFPQGQKIREKMDRLVEQNNRNQAKAQAKAETKRQKLEKNKAEGSDRAAAGAATIKSAARNPDSVKFEKVLIMDNGAVCYQFRAQNGFGGYNKERAVITGNDIRTSDMAGFSRKWNKNCASRSGEDITAYIDMTN